MSDVRGSGSNVGVLTVDDQEVFLRVAQEVIDATPGFEHLGEARSGGEAVELAASLFPDLVLVDARMPNMDGYETTRRLRAVHPTAVIVLVSTADVVDESRAACGATAYLRKTGFGPAALRRIWDEHGRPLV